MRWKWTRYPLNQLWPTYFPSKFAPGFWKKLRKQPMGRNPTQKTPENGIGLGVFAPSSHDGANLNFAKPHRIRDTNFHLNFSTLVSTSQLCSQLLNFSLNFSTLVSTSQHSNLNYDGNLNFDGNIKFLWIWCFSIYSIQISTDINIFVSIPIPFSY